MGTHIFGCTNVPELVDGAQHQFRPAEDAGLNAPTNAIGWTVPNTAITQGRVRVREVSFANPAGASSANFTISSGLADLLFKNGFE